METLTTIKQVSAQVRTMRQLGHTISLVPTMGALHDGHLELIRRAKSGVGFAKANSPFVIVSIFVNPTQFGPGEDYRAYPRDTDGDEAKACSAGADLIFAPTVEEIYPSGDVTFVEVGKLTEGMCSAFRPGHFRGVATVVTKLFNIVLPDAAYFGEKDYQQLKIIERLVIDLRLPVQIVPVPTVREPDGLAMSSRNAYLSTQERKAAAKLYAGLKAAQALAQQGEKDTAALIRATEHIISQEPLLRLEYIELRDAQTLDPLETLDRKAVLALAARIGKARLIDNLILQVP